MESSLKQKNIALHKCMVTFYREYPKGNNKKAIEDFCSDLQKRLIHTLKIDWKAK